MKSIYKKNIFPIDLTEEWVSISTNELNISKASSPIEVTDAGIDILIKE